MAAQTLAQRDGRPEPEALHRRHSPTAYPTNPSHSLILGLQRSAGNAAVARQFGRARSLAAPKHAGAVQVQRCGPVACDCSKEERADYDAKYPDQVEQESETDGATEASPVQRHAAPDDDSPAEDPDPAFVPGHRHDDDPASVQRCGCGDDSNESSGSVEPLDPQAVQRWPFSDDEQQPAESSGGGVTGWIEQQAGAAADAVSGATGGAVDWVKEKGGAAADAISDTASGAAGAVSDAASGAVDWAKEKSGAAADAISDTASGAAGAVAGAAGGAVDWAKEKGGAAADAITDAAGGAFDWAKEKGGTAADAVTDTAGEAADWAKQQAGAELEAKRASALAQIGGARARLGGLDLLAVQGGQLAALNGHLASLSAASGGQVSIPAIAASSGMSDGDDRTVAAGDIDALLGQLQSALSTPVEESGTPAQRSVQRLVPTPPKVPPQVAKGAAVIAIVIIIVIVIVLLILAIIAYALYRRKKNKEIEDLQPDEDPKPKPDPKIKEKDRKKGQRCLPDRECREQGPDPCPEALPIAWPLQLPLPGAGRLIRVKDEDVSFPKERRGGAQARLAQEIAENRRRLLPPPRPCDPTADQDPNEPRDAHHRHPLALGGRDADENLCSLGAADHQTGHPRLANQSEFADIYHDQCCYCSANINLHNAGQEYFIQSRK